MVEYLPVLMTVYDQNRANSLHRKSRQFCILVYCANMNLQYYLENGDNRDIIWLSPRGKNPDYPIILTFLLISTPNMTMNMEKNLKKYGSPPAENSKMKSRQKKRTCRICRICDSVCVHFFGQINR